MKPSSDPKIWRDEHGRIISLRYGDVYFAADGRREAEHVFCDGNDLASRFAALRPGQLFVIGETGFGTGLNFLVVSRLFAARAPAGARLVFVSVEEEILTDEEFALAHATFPELDRHAAGLRAGLAEARMRGEPTLRHVCGRRRDITLCLLHGDVEEVLSGVTLAADAWFLDGFAPAKNPAMWSTRVFALVADRTIDGGTFATFTVAGAVRRGLQAVGFDVARRPGFGRKREMSTGVFGARRVDRAPWRGCLHRRSTLPAPPSSVHVIGAGIAGASAARAFAERGARVLWSDPRGRAAGASGLPAAAFRPRLWLANGPVPDARIVAAAFRSASAWLAVRVGAAFARSGVLHAAVDAKSAEELAARVENPATRDLAVWLGAREAEERVGLPCAHGGVWMPRAGAVALCDAVIALGQHARIERLDPAAAGDAPDVDLTVLATARSPDRDLETLLPTRPVRGQALGLVPHADDPSLRSVLCGAGYAVPPFERGGLMWVGSTYDQGDDDVEVRTDDDERVRRRIRAHAALGALVDRSRVERRFAAVRATTSDRMPYVGPVPVAPTFESGFGHAVRGGPPVAPIDAAWDERTVVSLGHGSRGSVTAPFAALLLASRAFGEPLPCAPELLPRLEPARVLVRRLRRGGRTPRS